ncbi:MAG: extracellular solute-binding protein, partial [Thermoanaerobaculia bacterium]
MMSTRQRRPRGIAPAAASSLLLVFLLALTVSCHTDPPGTTVIEFWGMGREGELIDELLPQFYAENPDIRVRTQQIPWTAAHEKLLTAFVGESTPDVSQMGNTWVPEFEAIGAIAPLDQRLPGSAVVNIDDYFPGIWQTNIVDGQLYG